MPVSKLPEINRRRENCSALDGFPFPEIQPDLLLSCLERLLDYSETRVISQSRATSNKGATFKRCYKVGAFKCNVKYAL